MIKLPSLSVVLPAFNDEHTIAALIKKIVMLLPTITPDFEIVVVNDASTDGTASVLGDLQSKIPTLRVITHTKNRGYGGALIHGFHEARKEYIFYTDGDGQYNVGQLRDLVDAFESSVDMVTGFRHTRSDPWFRRLVGALYNQFVRLIFRLGVSDVDCDFRLFRKNILQGMSLTIGSGVFDAQFMWQCKVRQVRIKEVSVQHYPRPFGQSQFFTLPRLSRSLMDLCRLWFRSFSP